MAKNIEKQGNGKYFLSGSRIDDHRTRRKADRWVRAVNYLPVSHCLLSSWGAWKAEERCRPFPCCFWQTRGFHGERDLQGVNSPLPPPPPVQITAQETACWSSRGSNWHKNLCVLSLLKAELVKDQTSGQWLGLLQSQKSTQT